MMDLYLKINRPDGKKFMFVDNGKIRRGPSGRRDSVMLYPNKPTSLSDSDAKHLLEQDPGLVCQEAPDFSKPYPTTVDEWKDKVEEVTRDTGKLESTIKRLEEENALLRGKVKSLEADNSELKAAGSSKPRKQKASS